MPIGRHIELKHKLTFTRVPPVPVSERSRVAATSVLREEAHNSYIHDRRGVGRSSCAFGDGFRSRPRHTDEAKAMLMKAVAALKADKAKTLDLIDKGEGGFLGRDLYVFCANASDGKTVAIGNSNARAQTMGVDTRTLKDVNGKAFGQELCDAYQKPEGQITEVSYMWVRPGPDKTQVQKVSFATKVGDLGCGVGYYK